MNQVLLILERSAANLTVDKGSGDYVLEGIFAQFGVENNNKRIYEEKEYLPHLEYLKKKIAENRLMGELDHPDKFEVSLDKVSHIIENLEYDSKSRQIKGRVRVLDTPAGQIARNLIDAGVPISISSRAAGTVNENKKVNIKRIFTYDLVADPGFEDAQLSRINESFGLDTEDNLQIFDATGWDKNFAFESEAIKQDSSENKETGKVKETKEFVTIESMNKYSVLIKEEIEKVNNKLDAISESTNNSSNEEVEQLKEQVSQLTAYANELAKEINENRGYADHLRETINNSIDYTEKEVGTKVDQIIEYVNEEVTPHVDKLIDHNNHIAEKLNTAINYVDEEIAPLLDESLKHNDYLAEEIEKNRAYAEFLAENAVSSDDFNQLVEYAEFMFENYSGGSSKSGRSKDISEDEYITTGKTVRESSSKPEDIKKRATELTNNIDAVLEQIKKEKVDSISENKRYPFLSLINEENRAKFVELDEAQKEKVKTQLLETKSFDKAVLNEAFNSALVEKTDDTPTEPKWLAEAPEKYRKIYESLNEAAKNKIQTAAGWYSGKLETEYQIANFWQTRGLNETVKPEVNDVLNENRGTESKTVKQPGVINANLGYSSNRVNAIKESLNRFK